MKKFMIVAVFAAITAAALTGPADAKCRGVVIWGYGIGLCLPH